MPLDRNKPLRGVTRLRDTMDRILEESFVQPLRGALDSVDGGAAGSFPMDVVDAGDRFVLRAALPGVMPDDVHVQVQGDILTVKGSVKAHTEKEHARWLVRELRNGAFQREIRLPAGVLADRAEAQFEHGLLTLTLPKVTETGPRRIEVTRRQAPAAERSNPSVSDPTKAEVAPGVMPATKPGMANTADTPPKDAVTAESEGSFPASDPPSWTPERA
jgi:HSP20 family protein